MGQNDFPQVGDVVVSEAFAYGTKDPHFGSRITVDGETQTYTAEYGISQEAREIAIAITGDIPPKRVTINLAAYDLSRGQAEFVVEEAAMQGGSNSGHDDRPDGWHIVGRRLNTNGTFNPVGEEIEFYMSGFSGVIIPPERVRIVRKMKKMFV
jgi:hypothetical protein